MHQTQIVTLGIDGILAERLRELAQAERVWLRETSQFAACVNLLRAAPRVFIVRLGRDVVRELTLVEHVHACSPRTAIIAVGEADNPVLAGLAWEMGATFALFPPTPLERITDILVPILREGAA